MDLQNDSSIPTTRQLGKRAAPTHAEYRHAPLIRYRMLGLTIVQTMVIMLILGVAGKLGVDYVVEKRAAAPVAGASRAH